MHDPAFLQASLHALLPALGPASVAALVRLFLPCTVDKGGVLLHQGGCWNRVYLIERGIVRMLVTDRTGREFNKNFHREGALVFPLTAGMEELPSLFGMAALEHTVLWQAPVAAFRRCLLECGAWEQLRMVFLQRLVTQKLQREHDLLALDGMTRYRRLCEREPELAARVPVAHLASYLGLTDVSLSRIRRRIREQGD